MLFRSQHDLISANIKVESSEENAASLEKENKELLLNKAKLETSLADALLGKVKGQPPTGQAEPAGESREAHSSADSQSAVGQAENKKQTSNRKK